jgi:hypothetical protein
MKSIILLTDGTTGEAKGVIKEGEVVEIECLDENGGMFTKVGEV